MMSIQKYPLRNFIIINDKYKLDGKPEELEETLDNFVQKYSSFKTFNEYINAWNSLKKIDFNTLINIAPDFGSLYNENELFRLLDEYIKEKYK